MSGQGATDPTQGGSITDPSQTVAKGKGKAIDTQQDVSMGEDEDSSDEETGAEDDVWTDFIYQCVHD